MASVLFIGDHDRPTPSYAAVRRRGTVLGTGQPADALRKMASFRSSDVEGGASHQPRARVATVILANDGFCELCGFHH